MTPVRVAEFEICLAGQSQKWNLVQNRVNPSALDAYPKVSLLIWITAVAGCVEGEFNMLRRP